MTTARTPDSMDRMRGCSRKHRYSNKRDAHRAAKRSRRRTGEEIEEYPCRFCGGWHIGHVPSSERAS